MLSPLSKSQYIMITLNLSNICKQYPYHWIINILFDVKLLFTNVPLDFTIDLRLKHIYENNNIQTPKTKYFSY